MNPTLPLYLLLAAEDALPRDFSAAIAGYSAQWSVRFSRVAPLSKEVLVSTNLNLRTPPDLSAQVEALLDHASVALSALRETESRSALSQVARLLYAHPELPEGAWLMAEHHLLASELAGNPEQPESASLEAAAFALEGPRAEPFREGTPPRRATRGPPTVEVSIAGLSERERVEWDAELRSLPLSTPAGEHRLRVFRGDRVVWAGWVAVSEVEARLEVKLEPIVPCSAEDFEGTVLSSSGPIAPRGVRCSAWAAGASTKNGFRVALCHGSRCGSFQAPASLGDSLRPAGPAIVTTGFPRWALWAAAGIGAAAATSLVLWQAGAFSEAPASRERWVYEGLR